MSRRITKIKQDRKRVQIRYERTKGPDSDPDIYTLDCGDDPAPSFREAMDALAPHVKECLEIEERDWELGLEVRSVSLSDSEGVMGATITAIKTLARSRSPLVVNTPHKPEEPSSEGDPDAPIYCLTAGCASAIHRLLDEADAYIDGRREQPGLYDAQPEAATA